MRKKLLALSITLSLLPARALADVPVEVPDQVKGPDAYAVISRTTNILLLVAGAAGVIAIVVGGIMYITSAGDEKRVNSAKNTILYAVIGLVIAFLAYAIAAFVISGLQSGAPK